ncbi:MAG: DNA-directed RNA polymerase subunit beta', partial [Malacoplasma sp.]|nr:DNA-directed RNA polymerase subunit beta' [Malacoplasma sp.]
MANKQNRIDINNIKALQLSIASPERMRQWSFGEVTCSETINYKTLKPEKNGLFDEAIFGPLKDYECACGKYKKVKYQGKKCERCGVEITESIVRRERMGHIELACPIAHPWMVKELPNPSKISILLEIPFKQVEQVIYFVSYIVLEIPEKWKKFFFEKKIKRGAASKVVDEQKWPVLDLTGSQTSKKDRAKLREILSELISTIKPNTLDADRAKIYYDRLKESALPFSIEEVFGFISRHTGIKFGIGAEAIQTLLRNLDLQKELSDTQKKLKALNVSDKNIVKNEAEYTKVAQKYRKLTRRLETLKWFIESNNRPEWMILNVVPVTPPDTRPIVQLDGGKFTTSDINNFYRKVIIRNNRLKKLQAENAPSIILNNEKRMLQEAVDALYDNASRSKPVMSKDRRA